MVHSAFRSLSVVGALAGSALVMSQTAGGSERLINLDPSGPLGVGKVRADASFAFHKGDEGRTYMSASAGFGLSPGWEVGLRTSGARRGSFAGPGFTIDTGGRDFEIYAKYAITALPGLTVTGGVSFPDTPAQDKQFVTAAAMYAVPNPGQSHRLYVGAKAAMRADSNIWALCGGFAAPVGNGVEIVGDVTGILRGNNTIGTDSGNRTKRAVFGLGLRYTPKLAEGTPTASVTLGLSNGLGSTTGFSMTPALGGSMALTLGVSVRN
ncbi:MAG: hypothetical protein KIS66_11550 [Fimbriimonadaceae bacterium]|nr:hypothetical protein [Fimbriimonadaceae bacterium]